MVLKSKRHIFGTKEFTIKERDYTYLQMDETINGKNPIEPDEIVEVK